MKNQRPEFKAWEALTKAQIASNISAINHLKAELKATQTLLKVTARSLNKAREIEAKMME